MRTTPTVTIRCDGSVLCDEALTARITRPERWQAEADDYALACGWQVNEHGDFCEQHKQDNSLLMRTE